MTTAVNTRQVPAPGLVAGFLTQVHDRPHATALVFNGAETTYRELYDLAGRERDRLARLALAPGEPVGVLADKSPATVALVLACLLARRPVMLPSPALADTLLADLFAQAGCTHVLAPGGESARVGPNPDVAAQPLPAEEAAEVAFLLTTSGSTSLPKIVPLGRDEVDRFVAWAGAAFDIGPDRTVLNYAPSTSTCACWTCGPPWPAAGGPSWSTPPSPPTAVTCSTWSTGTRCTSYRPSRWPSACSRTRPPRPASPSRPSST